ncbi:MAG: hypothetical protein QF464_06420 [Myxococcota bacterium]|jgi:hypothetical protein|nr:hypothetical protein [Myxococcota bacterium]
MLLATSGLVGCVDSTAPAGGDFVQNEPDPDAADGCAAGCDDGNPCTDDACAGDACEHVPVAGCTVLACNGLGLMDVAGLAGLDDGDAWKIAAQPSVQGEPAGCTEAACEPANQCCNTCDAELALLVDGELLQPITADQGGWWGCAVDECGAPLFCDPLAIGSDYWLWGKIDASDDSARYVAQGWCRQTTADTLPGEYLGTWVSETAEAQTVELAIDHLGSWSISLQGVRDCDTCAYTVPSQFASGIVVGDGSMEFIVSVCTDGDTCEPSARRDVNVRLLSHEDRLIGTFEEANSLEGFGQPYAGAIGLERLEL